MMLIPIEVRVGIIILLIAGIFTAGWKVKSALVDAYELKELKEAIKERDELQDKVNALSGKVNDLIIENNKVQERIVERTYKEIEKPVYKECILPKSGVDLRNEQIRELNKSIRGETPRVEP